MRPKSPNAVSAPRRSSRKSMACSRVSRVSGRCTRAQRLLEGRHRLAVCRVPERLGASLPEIHHGFVPDLAPEGVMGQPFDLFGQTVHVLLFEHLDNARVQQAPPLLEQAAIRHLVRQGVLEVCSRSGNRRVSYRNSAVWRCARWRCSADFGMSAMACTSSRRYLCANDGSGCRRASPARQPVDACR